MSIAFQTCLSEDGGEFLDWESSTIVDALLYCADRTPDLKMYTFLGDGENETDGATAAELASQVTSLGEWLGRFLPQGGRVVLLYDSSLDYIRGLLACICAGLVPVSGVHPKAFGARERFLSVCKDAEAAAVIGNRGVLGEFQKVCADDIGSAGFRWIPTDTIRIVPSPKVARPHSDDLALIQYTSGSTKTPRGVMLSHRNIAANLYRQSKAFGYRKGDCGVNWLPLSHDMGLIGGALMTLGTGGRCILLSPEHVAEKPLRWLRAISTYRATLSGGPDFGYGLCLRSITQAEIDTLDLSCWEVAFNGAEYIRPRTMSEFAARFASTGFMPSAFLACYGLAEATLLVTASERGTGVAFRGFSREAIAHGRALEPESARDERLMADCGRPPEGTIVCIADAESEQELPEGCVGEIRVRSAGVAGGYVNRRAESARVFESGVAGREGAYLRTGDRGFLLNGSLFVTGRHDNRLQIGSHTLDPEDVSAALEDFHARIRVFATAIFMDRTGAEPVMIVASELPSGSTDDVGDLARMMAERVTGAFPVRQCRVVLLRSGALPRTPSGKIRIGEAAENLSRGALPVVHDHLEKLAGSDQVRVLKISSKGI